MGDIGSVGPKWHAELGKLSEVMPICKKQQPTSDIKQLLIDLQIVYGLSKFSTSSSFNVPLIAKAICDLKAEIEVCREKDSDVHDDDQTTRVYKFLTLSDTHSPSLFDMCNNYLQNPTQANLVNLIGELSTGSISELYQDISNWYGSSTIAGLLVDSKYYDYRTPNCPKSFRSDIYQLWQDLSRFLGSKQAKDAYVVAQDILKIDSEIKDLPSLDGIMQSFLLVFNTEIDGKSLLDRAKAATLTDASQIMEILSDSTAAYGGQTLQSFVDWIRQNY